MNHQQPTTNLHIHTPYSFSAFNSVGQAAELAKREGVAVLGISDFDTIAGFDAFARACEQESIYAVFGMETIALSTEDQTSGRRWNDPSNPGRIYFCGKALDYPARPTERVSRLLEDKFSAMQQQMKEMIGKLNLHVDAVGVAGILGEFDYETILATLCEGTVRERHLAKTLDRRIATVAPDRAERRQLLQTLYGGKPSKVDVENSVALQDELRGNLLKAGMPAFVPEDPSGYLTLESARDLMTEMGGIPCYPILADGTKGEPTEVEADPKELAQELVRYGVRCVEFIPTRNDMRVLKSYVEVLSRHGMVVTCGTEHNTPALEPIVPTCKGGVEFDDDLKQVFWRGACVIAGYQHLKVREGLHYSDELMACHEQLLRMEQAGEGIICEFHDGTGNSLEQGRRNA